MKDFYRQIGMFIFTKISHRRILNLILVSMMFAFAHGINGQTSYRVPLNLIDVFDFEFASDPRVSPDGESVVYVRNYFDIMTDRGRSDLWIVNGESVNQPFLPTAEYKNPSSPRWSLDGDRVMFLARDQRGKSQIFCYWLKSGKIGQLSRLTQSPSGITWSPNGKSIAFFMRVPAKQKPFASLPDKPKGAKWADAPKVVTRLRFRANGTGFLPFGYRHLFVMSADGGSPRQITRGNFNHGGRLSWSPDSSSIIFSANRSKNWEYESNSELYRSSVRTGSISQLTNRNGPDTNPAYTPDGKTIAYVGYDDKLLGYHNRLLHIMNDDGTGKRVLTGKLDRSVSAPVWNPYAKSWLFTYSDYGNTRLAMVNRDGKITKLAKNLGSNSNGRPYGGGGQVSVSRNGTVAFTMTRPTHPGDVAIVRPNGEVKRLTHLNDDLLEGRALGKVKEIRFNSSYDKREVQGWYITPPNFDPKRKYPMILEIHGGPFADYGDRFTAELQLYAAAGYVVLYVNPRGSTSYGAEFANLIHHNYPNNDYDDLISGVDALLEKGFTDKNKLFVTGGSGGGVLTAWIVGKTDRFKAAVVAKPVINWYSFVLTADSTPFFYKYWFSGFPWDKQDEYMKRSPISLVGNVQTPTMLLTGESDLRTPISETEQFYNALKLRKIDTAMVRIPGASHGIASRPSRLMAKVAYILKWFEKYNSKP